MGYFLHYFPQMHNASAESNKMKAASNINLTTQINDFLVNLDNPLNPDSKPDVRGKIYIVTCVVKKSGVLFSIVR